MMRRALLIAVTVLLAHAPAQAQTSELGVMAGVTPDVALEKHALQIDEAKIAGEFTFVMHGAHFFSPHWGLEGTWTQQSAALEAGTSLGDAELYSMSIGQLHANAVYRFGGSYFQPFVSAGIGATFFRAVDLPSETKLSYEFGGGVKVYPWKNIGWRAQVRYKPTRLNDTSSGDFCDGFGFCQASLHQFDFLAGVSLRF
jgi:opacity protein-like surface antigen